jgi:hypothetical protein
VFKFSNPDGLFAIDKDSEVALHFTNGFFVSPKAEKEGEKPIDIPGATKIGKGEAITWHISAAQINEAFKAALFKKNANAAIMAYEKKDPTYRRTGEKLNLYVTGVGSKISQGWYPVPLGAQIDTSNTNVHNEVMNPIKSQRSGNNFVTVSDPLDRVGNGNGHEHSFMDSYSGALAQLSDGRTFDQIKNIEYSAGGNHFLQEGVNQYAGAALLHPDHKGIIVALAGGQEMEDALLSCRLSSDGPTWEPQKRIFKEQEAENMVNRAAGYIGHIANVAASEKGVTFKISPDNKEGDWFGCAKGPNFNKSNGAEFSYATTLYVAPGKRTIEKNNKTLAINTSPL